MSQHTAQNGPPEIPRDAYPMARLTSEFFLRSIDLLTRVQGEVPSLRPWVRYEFADPQLQSLSSGQKIMVRVGLENERRLKVRLKVLRGLVAKGAVAQPKP